MQVRAIVLIGFFIPWIANAVLPTAPYLIDREGVRENITHLSPVIPPADEPDGLRPCCAFGYNLKAKALGIPVPFYRLDNVIETTSLGKHIYNDRLFGAIANLAGLSGEKNGIIYTSRGGFIDIAHVRDTADMTLFLFSHIWAQSGKDRVIDLGDELAQRRIRLFAFATPQDEMQRYVLSTRLAGWLAFQVAAWHEVAQWYGYESVSGFSEAVSAFSPEDLYSNLLGARLAMALILRGDASSIAQYNRAMTVILPEALEQLGAAPAQMTRFHFDMLDGQWWDSHRYVPEKFLVLKRNYDTSGSRRLPTRVPGESTEPVQLNLPDKFGDFTLSSLGELQLWPGHKMKALPAPLRDYYTWRDFPALAQQAHLQDNVEREKAHR